MAKQRPEDVIWCYGRFEMVSADGQIVHMADAAERPIERMQMLLQQGARITLGVKRPRVDYSTNTAHNGRGDVFRFVEMGR